MCWGNILISDYVSGEVLCKMPIVSFIIARQHTMQAERDIVMASQPVCRSVQCRYCV